MFKAIFKCRYNWFDIVAISLIVYYAHGFWMWAALIVAYAILSAIGEIATDQ